MLETKCTSSVRTIAYTNTGNKQKETESSAVAERPRDASCLSVVSFNIPTAQFLPRDPMRKRGKCRHPVSVCASVTFVDHFKTNKHIFEIFSTSGSQAIGAVSGSRVLYPNFLLDS